MIRAIFLDVDGTLISHRISDIPSSALDALHRLREKGVGIYLATGRHYRTLRSLPLHDFPFDGSITLTGHLVYGPAGEPLLRLPLSAPDTRTLTGLFREKALPILLMEEDRVYINYCDDLVSSMMRSVSTGLPDLGEYAGAPLYSAVFYCPREKAEGLISSLEDCRLSAWHSTGFDIISRRAGKVRGIREIMRLKGLSPEEIAVFGDSDNDVEMLSFSQNGIAMGNGTPAAKAAASWVAPDIDRDGLLQAFRHLGLLP